MWIITNNGQNIYIYTYVFFDMEIGLWPHIQDEHTHTQRYMHEYTIITSNPVLWARTFLKWHYNNNTTVRYVLDWRSREKEREKRAKKKWRNDENRTLLKTRGEYIMPTWYKKSDVSTNHTFECYVMPCYMRCSTDCAQQIFFFLLQSAFVHYSHLLTFR